MPSVAKTSATATIFRWVRRLAASSEKLFMTRSPKTFPVISRGEPAEGSCPRHLRGGPAPGPPINRRIEELRPWREQAMRGQVEAAGLIGGRRCKDGFGCHLGHGQGSCS